MAIKVRIVDPPTIQLKSSAGTVKQVDSGNGLTGGPITSTGTISVNANTGLIANSSGLFLANSVLFPNTINGNTAQDLRDYSDSVSGIAYSNAISVANTLASSAYSNSVIVANTLASSAYSNAILLANDYASSAYSNAILMANDYASSAYSNAILVANTLASSAYSNAILVANTLASSAYSNAIIFASNASNINTGTLSSSLLPVSGVIANVYGSATEVPILTIDATGRVTNISLANVDGIESFTYSSNTNTLSLLASDGATFNVAINSVNDFIVTGNLTVNGTQTYIQSNSVLFDDNILVLNKAINNDPSDIGIVGHYIDSQTLSWGSESISWGSNTAAWGAQNSYSGVFRDATDGIWKIFQSYTPDPDSSFEIDTANGSFNLAPLQISTLYANSISANGSVGTNGQVLHSDGTNIYWATDDVNYPAGSNTEIQFNDSGNFGANSGLTFDSALGRLNVGNVGITSQTVFFGNSGLSFSNGSSNVVFVSANGNVGIRTTSPAALLHLNDSGGASINDPTYSSTLNYQMVLGTNVTSADGTNAILFGSGSYGNNPIIRFKASGGSKGYIGWAGGETYYFVGTHNTKDLRLRTNSADRLTVKGDGTVGIGTTTPAEKLDVAGNIVTKNSTTPTSIGVYGTYTDSLNYERLKLTANSTAHYLISENLGTGTSKPLYLGSNNATTMTLAANGNVGIGTTTPSVPLHVVGPSGSTGLLLYASSQPILKLADATSGATSSDGLDLMQVGSDSYIINRESGGLKFYAGNALGMMLYNSGVTIGASFAGGSGPANGLAVQGNVGIGTTTPAEKLDVAGNIQSSNTVFAVHFDNVSDITLKENISSLNNTIDTLNKLNPVSFDWKDSKTKSYGLIAQEVEQILPTIVHSKQDGTKTVNYIEIIAFLIAAVKDLQRQIDDINTK